MEIALETVINHAPVVLFELDPQGIFTLSEGKGLEKLGLEPGEVVGKSVFEVYADQSDVLEDVRRALAGEPFTVTREVAGVSYSVVYNPTVDDAGRVVSVTGVAFDITEETRAKASLQDSEEQYRVLFENSPIPIYVYDADTLTFLTVNHAAIQHYGYSRDEFLRMTLKDLRPIEDMPKLLEALSQRGQSNGESGNKGVWQHRKKDGTLIDVEITANSLRFEGKDARLVMVNDVTERRRMEQALRASEERYRLVSELTSDYAYSYRIQPDGTLVHEWVTDSFERIIGYTHEEIDAQGQTALYHPDDEPAVEAALQQVLRGQPVNGEYRIITKSGEIRWLSIRRLPLWDARENRVVRMYGVAQDITERKRAEANLRYQASLLENVNDAIISVNMDGNIVSWNKAAERIYGWRVEEVTGKLVEAVLKIEYLHQSREEVLREFIENGYWRGEVIQYHKDGSPIDIVASVRLLKDAQGKSSGMVAVNRDVTDYRVAEKAVQQQAELLQTVFDTLPVMVVVFDPNGQRTLINREYERTLGWSLAEIWRHPDVMSELYPDPDYRRYVQEHMTASDNDWHEFKIRTRDGCIIDTLWANARLSDGSIIGIGQDITERKRAQEDLLKARVLDAELRKERELNDLKTRFISMLSHEFRTPLAVVLSSADILRRYRERLSPEKIEEHLDKIAKQVSRLTPLIDDVLALNRAETVREHLQPMPIDLEAFCWMLIDELQPTAPHHRIVFTGDSAATDIEADEKYLRLAITNLLSNAIKYSPQGGRIEVELFRNGAEVTLSVTDHGIGVPEEDQAHLFEVFHRATNVGAISGTGLGLSIVKRAVELHKGRVEFSSQEGIGTRFTLRLPMASGAVTIGGGSIS